MSIDIFYGENIEIMKSMPDGCFNLSMVDPPFNTGNIQTRGGIEYEDEFNDYKSFILPRLTEAWRLLKPNGSLFVLLDSRESHYVKVWMDETFGRDKYRQSIHWHWDYGGKPKNKYAAKHNEILWYVKNPKDYIFNYDQIDRVPYLAPSLCGPEKAAKGKVITNVWFMTIVPTMSKEKTGYPTQKPLSILRRIVKMHSNPGDNLLDFFAGSGSFGRAAAELGRDCTLIDNNPQAIEIMKKNLETFNPNFKEISYNASILA